MNAPSPWTPTPEALLLEHAWARRLAFRLVQDASLADDLAQEACVRALGRATAGGPRAWLAAVVRNLARQCRRERGRRARREETAARPEALPSAAESLERLAVQQDVVRAVLALEEPYRSTIVLRFYEELPPRRIAARQGVPVATVKTRLARGLAMLRAALDREHGGDGRTWALFLLPLARTSGPAALLTGTLAMSTSVKVGVAATLLILLAVWFAQREPHPLGVLVNASRASAPEETLASIASVERVPSADAHASAEVSHAPVSPAATMASERTVSGRVIDASGNPVSGVELGVRGWNGARGDMDEIENPTFGSALWTEALPASAPLALSGSDGRFTLVLAQEQRGRVVSQDERWESVLTPIARVRSEEDQVLVVAPRFRLVGAVRDEDGNPLAGAEIRFGVPRARIRASGTNLEDTLASGWSTTSDELGLFELERLPAVAGAKLRAELEPFDTKTIEREQWLDGELEIVLARAAGAWLEGLVQARGQPVKSAVVALGSHAKKTDSRGRFQIHMEGLEREPELCALAAGFMPARVSGDPNEDGTVRWPPFVRIELDGEPLVLAGTVVDVEGRPLAGQEIWLMEGRITLRDRIPFLLESVLAGSTEGRAGTKTDADGRFRLGGLEDRAYRLRIVDPATALVLDAGPFQAGSSELRLVQPTDRVWPVLRGAVVSRAGTPLAGVAVNVERTVDLIGVEDSMYFRFDAGGARAETDASGAFELRDVPMEGVHLSVNDMDVVDPRLELDASMDPMDLRVVVDRWVQIEVHASGALAGAGEYTVLDASARPLAIEAPIAGGTSELYSQSLVDGHSPVVKVPEHGAIVVLHGEAGELARQAILLRAGVVHLVEF